MSRNVSQIVGLAVGRVSAETFLARGPVPAIEGGRSALDGEDEYDEPTRNTTAVELDPLGVAAFGTETLREMQRRGVGDLDVEHYGPEVGVLAAIHCIIVSTGAYALATSNVVDSSAVESPPTQTSKVEASITQSRAAALQ